MLEGMSLGLTPTQADGFTTTTGFCESRVSPDSIYGLLHRECFRLFGDEMFADLFADSGRNCVPPMIVAVVMVLQRFEGCSDREAVDRFAFDARWKYAAGGLSFDYTSFVHTVLVDMRARLARSERPDRIFEVVLETAEKAGLVGRRRVLDSTSLYDAVATMDTVTLIRSAIRGMLAACDRVLEDELRGLLARDDDYATTGKPVCDYEDPQAREAMIDALARDARALLSALDGRELSVGVGQAAALLAAVVGQDLDEGVDGAVRIARRVAKDRIVSTVDPDARHGDKTSARGFDGYKGHVAVDPDSELITATTVTVLGAPVPTTVSGVNVVRYRPDVERAIYFCCLEALQNAYKHAHTATAAHVRIATRGRELTFEVSDNGHGFHVGTVAVGAGLHNMHDRVASLGGSLTIDAARGRGTRITGAIPLTANRAPRTGRDDTSG
jgi:signal transduction histidine kinase